MEPEEGGVLDMALKRSLLLVFLQSLDNVCCDSQAVKLLFEKSPEF
jgi:hypothetical protein